MKSFYIVLLITITWTSSLPVQGQDSINIGTRHSLFSNILNEERMYWIYEPEKQPGEEEKDYPVLYIRILHYFHYQHQIYQVRIFL